MDDEELVKLALNGNHQAYAHLVERYTPLLYAFCRARVWRHDVVPDLVQETFTRAWQQLRTLEERARFGAWVFGIARNLCASWCRDKENRQTRFTELDKQPDPLAPAPPGGEDVDALMAEVRRLPRPLREALLQRLLNPHQTYEQLAPRLKLTPTVFSGRLARARTLLYRRLRPRAAPPRDELEQALKAFRERVKSSSTAAVTPPKRFPQAVWDELVRQGKLNKVGHGTYELVEE